MINLSICVLIFHSRADNAVLLAEVLQGEIYSALGKFYFTKPQLLNVVKLCKSLM